MSSDYLRVKKQLDNLIALRDSQISVILDMNFYKDIQDIAEQFLSSSNELFSEAGNKIRQALSSVGGTKKTSGSNPALDKMIAELTAEINEIKISKEVFRS